ncbi:MAG: hypothetical protein ACREUW_02115 [Burkholderiales bacterium]
MDSTFDHHAAFLAHQPIRGVAFQHNDAVRVTAGEHCGKQGWLVGILELSGDPLYTVELETGADIRVLQSQMERIGIC